MATTVAITPEARVTELERRLAHCEEHRGHGRRKVNGQRAEIKRLEHDLLDARCKTDELQDQLKIDDDLAGVITRNALLRSQFLREEMMGKKVKARNQQLHKKVRSSVARVAEIHKNHLTRRYAPADENICVNCGRLTPCNLHREETSGDPDWPGSPCTFDFPVLAEMREKLEKAEAQIEVLTRDLSRSEVSASLRLGNWVRETERAEKAEAQRDVALEEVIELKTRENIMTYAAMVVERDKALDALREFRKLWDIGRVYSPELDALYNRAGGLLDDDTPKPQTTGPALQSFVTCPQCGDPVYEILSSQSFVGSCPCSKCVTENIQQETEDDAGHPDIYD